MKWSTKSPIIRLSRWLSLSLLTAATFTAPAFSADCNGNGTDDTQDIEAARSEDCNDNGIPDVCEQSLLRLERDSVALELVHPVNAVVTADIDGDGDLDVLTADITGSPAGGMTLYLRDDRDGGGNVSRRKSFVESSKVFAVATGDFDNDGDLDLADLTREALSVFWNDGSLDFSRKSLIPRPTGSGDDDLLAADLNADGSDDLVVAHAGQDAVIFYPGSEDGNLVALDPLAVGDSPRHVRAGDIDGDGDPDLVTANRISSDVSVLINRSMTGESIDFFVAASAAVGGKPRSLALADLDGDGLSDVVTGNKDTTEILINGGDGRSFAASTFVTSSFALETADMDGDAAIDIISVGQASETISVLINNGSGIFTSKIDFTSGGIIGSIVPGDFDGDGDVDIATELSPASLAFLSNGEGETLHFSSDTIPMINNQAPHTIAEADLDGDGDFDIVTGDGANATVSVLLNDGFGKLNTVSDQATGEYINSIVAGDLDRDGDTDLAFVGFDSETIRVLYNNGAGILDEQRDFDLRSPAFFVTAALLDDDDYLDLVTASFERNSISILRNDGVGSGNFREAPEDIEIPTDAGARAVTHGDFDGDGNYDLASANSVAGTISVVLNRGNLSFDPARNLSARGDPFSVAAGDWDQDEDIDLAAANDKSRTVSIFRNRGDGNFEFSQLIGIGHEAYSVAAADFDGDGLDDLLTTNEISGSVSLLRNLRDGRFFLSAQYSTGELPRFSAIEDMDNDGDLDIVTANRGSRDVTILINESAVETTTDFTTNLCTLEDFEDFSTRTFAGNSSVKYVLAAGEDPERPTYFQNSRKFPLHEEFMVTVIPGFSPDDLIPATQLRATREYFIGALERILTEEGYLFVYSIVTAPSREEVLSLEELRAVHERMSSAFTIPPLAYAPDLNGQDPLAREAADSWVDPGFPIFDGMVETDVEYIPYTIGVGFGRVRLLTRTKFDTANSDGRFTFQDIVVTDHAPRTIEGVIGGLVTAAPQGALSHLPILTARRGTPNAFVESAMSVFAPHQDQLVRFEVGPSGYVVNEASLEEAEEFWDMRPALPPLPAIDESYRGLDRFEEMDFSDEFALETRFGGKATGLARLQTILHGPWEEYREVGFAIPLSYYIEFMSTNRIPSDMDGDMITYEEYLTELSNEPRFQTDSTVRFEALEKFRDLARDLGRVPEGLVATLADRIEEVFGERSMTVRFRSSSNVEDGLQFNGAGLYESTSVCVLDSFDGDELGPSLCDATRQNERAIERALKKVWTSLWTFRAHEERAFFRIPQDAVSRDVGMGILVNRAFLDEAANGVAFTGDPSDPRGGCYLVTAQMGEESVVSPTPGILAERSMVEVVEGDVLDLRRERASNLAPAGEFVLSDEKLRELGALMGHIDQNYPLDTAGFAREEILLDLEFKLERDGFLAVKQIRPFLVSGQRRERPTFELEIPIDTIVCGVLNLNSPSDNPRAEYEAKSKLRFRSGTFELPARNCAFRADLIEEVLVGPTREVAVAAGPGVFQVEDLPDLSGGDGTPAGQRLYTFKYNQRFSLLGEEGERRLFDVRIFNLEFRAKDARPVEKTLVFDQELLTFGLSMLGYGENPPLTVTYGSCDFDTLPPWDVEFELEGNVSVRLREHFLPANDFRLTGPASLEAAEVLFENSRHIERQYWNLVYSSSRHNAGVTYWVALDPPITLTGVEGIVHVLELDAADPPEVFDIVPEPQQAAAAYLDESFQILARPTVLSYNKREFTGKTETRFSRGDASDDGEIDITDIFHTLNYLFLEGEAFSCIKAADTNDDGRLNLSDAIWTALYLFQGKVIASPFGVCGIDPTTDGLSCDRFAQCF